MKHLKKIDQVCRHFDFRGYDKVLDEYGKPDVVWAGPLALSFPVGSIGKHWHKDHTPKSGQAIYWNGDCNIYE